MKRDMDLIRLILLEAEECCGVQYCAPTPEGYDKQAVDYHVNLLRTGGYVEVTEGHRLVKSLTWEGHDFLDAIRDPGVWDKVKAKAGEAADSLPVEIIKQLAVTILKDTLGSGGA